MTEQGWTESLSVLHWTAAQGGKKWHLGGERRAFLGQNLNGAVCCRCSCWHDRRFQPRYICIFFRELSESAEFSANWWQWKAHWQGRAPVYTTHSCLHVAGTNACTHAFQLCSHNPDSILKNLLHPVFWILFCAGLTEVLINALSEAAVVYLDEEKRGATKVSHLVLQALLELLHSILQETVVACSPLQVRVWTNYKGADCNSSQKTT